LLWIPMPQDAGQLACRPRRVDVLRRGPPQETALRPTFGTEPEALAVIAQDFERGARTVPKDRERAAEGIVAECAAADGGESIEAFAEVDRRSGHKDAALRSHLEHAGISKKVRTNATSGGCGSWMWMRRRAPSARESSLSVPTGGV